MDFEKLINLLEETKGAYFQKLIADNQKKLAEVEMLMARQEVTAASESSD